MGDRVLTISYAEPRRDDTQPQQKEVKACYVGHLPDDVDDTKLIEAFAPIGEVRLSVPWCCPVPPAQPHAASDAKQSSPSTWSLQCQSNHKRSCMV